MIETEIECKYMIDSEMFSNMLNRYDFSSPIEHINHYFVDSDNRLRENHVTVRVRESSKGMYLQIKYGNKGLQKKSSEEIHLSVREEYSRKVSNLDDITTDEIERITGIQIRDIMHVGSMTTSRYRCYFGKDISLCLDKNQFLGVCDYELEVELADESTTGLESLLSELGITRVNSERLGKCSRFMRELAKRG